MKKLAVLVTAAALTTLAGPAQAATQTAGKPAARIVNAGSTPVTASRVIVSVTTTGVPTGARVRVIDDGHLIGSSRLTEGKAIVPISATVRGQKVTVVVAGKRRVVTVRNSAAALAASPWMVVNKKVSAGSFAPAHLESVGSFKADPRAAAAFERMSAAAVKQGTPLWVASSYRSATKQTRLYKAYVARDGREAADTFSARPGHSEHQTGLAIDVAGGRCILSGCFAKTPTGRWVAANAADYGFVIRYSAGDAASTGYRYEPWHLRYVGPWLAGYLASVGSPTLEQAFALGAAADYSRTR